MHTFKGLCRLFKLCEIKGMKRGLENMLRMDEALKYPSRSFQSIHIAGTNGKGSVSTKMARCISSTGLKVGLYTSPHLCNYCERIEINGKRISEERADELLLEIFKIADALEIPVTFFEATTLLAFYYFSLERVDIAVFEVGMGGRWDATNIIRPLLSIITSIDYDHTQYLGSTLEEIAVEKGGIIKIGVPVIVGPKAHCPKLQEIADLQKCSYILVEGEYEHYEEENRAIAKKALSYLPFTLPHDEGLKETPFGRFSLIHQDPPIILDVGHNPAALKAFLTRTQKAFPGKGVRALVAFSSDKDTSSLLQILAQEVAFIHLSEAPTSRAESVTALEKKLHTISFTCYSMEKNLSKAFLEAKYQASLHSHILVVTGTFFMMETILKTYAHGGVIQKVKGHALD